jgi:FkbH-like protein
MRLADLYWLPDAADLTERMLHASRDPAPQWDELVRLANCRLDFVQTNRLDRALQRCRLDDSSARVLKLAVLSSSTVDHLLPGCRVAALRRNFYLRTFAGTYGMYLGDLQDEDSALREFNPDVLLCAFHAQHLIGNPDPALGAPEADALVAQAADRIVQVWRLIRQSFQGQIIQQTVLPVRHNIVGSNEHRLRSSAVSLVERLNARLLDLAEEQRVDILAVDRVVRDDGLRAWHDPGLWHRAKQEISPLAAPAYGDLVARLIAAQQGHSSKCLVLDLDNTLWGGVIGDDGLEGIKLGQGSALGEAYLDFQHYASDLGRRGVILAVCSKNDPQTARLPFERHPEMVIKSEQIACFIANWNDKAENLRSLAQQLNIGIDSLVFADDNPIERNLVRQELPSVAVPELPDGPEFYARCLADAGYFEALHITAEDQERSAHYQANLAREQLRTSQTDVRGYLESLHMELRWQPFARVGLQRIVQLINKTNQFNLTTRRYSESEVVAMMQDGCTLTLQLRLVDRFGDNGMIGVVIGKLQDESLRLDTWLMSCRILGRQVEEATLNVVVSEAQRLGAGYLIGEYLPTQKNGIVREHYRKLGFQLADETGDGATRWLLSVAEFAPRPTFVRQTRTS